MRKTVLILTIATLLSPLAAMADTYTALWKKYSDAQEKDQPRTGLAVLSQIVTKATAEGGYGHLLKAELETIKVLNDISNDSLAPAVARFGRKAKQAEGKDKVLAAVYNCVLGKMYQYNPAMSDSSDVVSRRYFEQALADPSALAGTKSSAYDPLIQNGSDSRLFGNDLLHVIAYETAMFDKAHQYYATHSNRAATMLTALEMIRQHRPSPTVPVKKSRYIVSLDSLIVLYSDLRSCGEVAIERYEYMNGCPGTTDMQRMLYLNYAIDKWGGWPHINRLINVRKSIVTPSLTASLEATAAAPGIGKWLRLEVRHIDNVTVTVTPVNSDGLAMGRNFNIQNKDNLAKVRSKLVTSKAKTFTRRYAGIPEHIITSDSIEIKPTELGVYMIEVKPDNKDVAAVQFLYYATRLFVVSQSLPHDKIRYGVLDAVTGQPVPGATLRLDWHKWQAEKYKCPTSLTADSQGECVLTCPESNVDPNYIYVKAGQDTAFPKSSINSYFGYNSHKDERVGTKLYTDRVIYRPGQTVNVALLAYRATSPDSIKACPGKAVDVTFRDANYKEIAKKQLSTDEYGVASTSFVIPTGGLNGRYSIMTSLGGVKGITVAEYKKTTFKVEFPDVNQRYHDGDTLVVTAKAVTYTGVPVQGAKVSYTVRRDCRMFWRRFTNVKGDNNELLTDTLTTDSTGSFRIEMPMLLPEGGKEARWSMYDITASVQVTDLAGESQSGELSLPLSLRSTFFDCNLPERINKDSLRQVTFTLKNTAGLDVDAPVTFSLDGKTYTTHTNQPFSLDGLAIASGRHNITAVCEDDTLTKAITVFSMDDKRPAEPVTDWFYVSGGKFKDTSTPVYIQTGTSEKGVHALYTVISGNQLLEKGVMDMSDTICTRKFVYKPEYGDGIHFSYVFVRDGVMYTHSVFIERPVPDPRLVLKWSTFRDRLQPGQRETWKLNITTPDGKPARASLMATLYDKSLDQIERHEWSFDDYYPVGSVTSWWSTVYKPRASRYTSMRFKFLANHPLQLSWIDQDHFVQYTYWDRNYSCILQECVTVGYGTSRASAKKFSPPRSDANQVESVDEVMMVKEAEVMPEAAEDAVGSALGVTQTVPTTVQMRENLAETAFFMPSLVSDEKGEVALSFTLPQSVTTWRFMGIAHDKAMRHGVLTADAVAKKTLMVQPNMPRFLRTGDMAVLTARVQNTSEAAISGKAVLTFLDPVSMRELSRSSVPFKVKAEGTETVSFNIDTDALQRSGADQLVICRISAEAGGCSDGEQHYLPLLPNTQKVITTQPFFINGSGSETIDLNALQGGKTRSADRKVTFEYTANPTWLLVQSLPSMSKPSCDNAVCLAAAYYANTLASFILDNSPQVKAVFEQWKNETGNEKSLMSALEKNQDVKSIMLSETPWVALAETEAQQKRSVVELFDEGLLASRQSAITDKLAQLQLSDGSFSWFQGMQGSYIMTFCVAKMLTRLHLMTGGNQLKQMNSRAVAWLCKRMVKWVNELKARERKGEKITFCDTDALQYLYLCSMYDGKLTSAASEANRYLIGKLQASPALSDIYDKALAAVVLSRSGATSKAREYVESIRQYTVRKEGMGRYFDSDRTHYCAVDYRVPAQVSAIEAIRLVDPADSLTVAEMQQWLLRLKQTHSWDTELASADAVYTFFTTSMGGKPCLSPLSETGKVTVRTDKRALYAPQSIGLGYVKDTFTDANANSLTVNTTGNGLSWGAVYVTETVPVTDIKATGSGLTIKREVLNAKKAKVGDKVTVRLTIHADRDYDFVMVEDKRPACLEPVTQTSGYYGGCYQEVKDNSTRMYFDWFRKGKHVVETEYYVDRKGNYTSGAATVQCAYSPEFAGRDKALNMKISE